MAQINHNISNPNDGLGDQLRTGFANQNAMNTELYSTKVDKVTGKGLTENEFTNTEKAKLAALAAGAEVNVQADWAQSNTLADDYIKNKPTGLGDPPIISLQDVTTAGGTTDKKIAINVLGGERPALAASTTTPNAISGYSVSGAGIAGYSYSGQAALFDIPISNNSNIVEFQKDGKIQASITHDGKVVANALNVAGNSTFNGLVTAPTATLGTNTTQLATTAFVQSNLAKKTYSITFSWDASTYAASASVYYVNRESKAITTPTFTTNNLTSGVPLPFNCKIIGITYAHNVLAATDLQMRVYKVLASTTAHTQVASKLISGNINVYAPTTDYNDAATFNCATETVSLGFLNPTISTGLWRSAAVTILFQEL